jgi:TolA-binding protein
MTYRLKHGLAAVFCAVGLAAGAGHALAQVSLDEPPLDEHAAKRLDRMEKAMKELRAIVFQGRETGAPVVVQPADTQSQIAGLGDKIGDLTQTLARVNGELEVIKHDLDEARQSVSDLRAENVALKDRVSALEAAGKAAASPPPPPPPPPGAAASGDAASAFTAAKAAFDGGDMASAEAGFRDYVDRFGDGPGGPEARYYLARTLMAREAWPDAATAEIGAIRGWPHTRWAPEAVLDLSRSLLAMGKTADACQTLDELARRYPKPSPAVTKGAAAARAQGKCGQSG